MLTGPFKVGLISSDVTNCKTVPLFYKILKKETKNPKWGTSLPPKTKPPMGLHSLCKGKHEIKVPRRKRQEQNLSVPIPLLGDRGKINSPENLYHKLVFIHRSLNSHQWYQKKTKETTNNLRLCQVTSTMIYKTLNITIIPILHMSK